MKNIFIINIFLLVIFAFVLQSCDKSPALEEKKLIKVYAEMIFMQDTSSLSPSVIKDKVLNRFNIYENQYSESISFYNKNPERWQKFFDEVIVYIESLKPKPKTGDVKSSQEQSLSVDKKNP